MYSCLYLSYSHFVCTNTVNNMAEVDVLCLLSAKMKNVGKIIFTDL